MMDRFPFLRIRYFLMAFILCLSTWGLSSFVQIAVNQSESLPQRAFLIMPSHTVTYGTYVSFDNAWVHKNIIKQVAGLPGDEIEIIEGIVWLKRCIGPLQATTTQGKPLTPMTSGVIPEGHIFVTSPHERSFDSRYSEVGLIPMSLTKKAVPIF